MRYKPGQNLRQEGIDLARNMAEKYNFSSETVHFTVTSTIPRAIQTAIAMGIAVNETRDELSDLGFEYSINEIQQNKNLISQMDELLSSVMLRINDNETILIISHGGFPEVMLLNCISTYTVDYLYDYCEGYKLSYDGNSWKLVETYLQPRNEKNHE